MTLLSIMDPEGAKSRRGRRLKRRVYVNKVLYLRIILYLFEKYITDISVIEFLCMLGSKLCLAYRLL